MAGVVLFDVDKTLVSDSKDVSEYIAESIRNIYGRIVEVNLSSMEGESTQNVVKAVLEKNEVPADEIEGKLKRIMEDVYYTYYNVAGHDRLLLKDGAKELLNELEKNGVAIGVATGEAERIVKLKTDKTGISNFFKFGTYGNNSRDLSEIVRNAMQQANGSPALVIASSPYMLKAAKAAGAIAVGVANSRYSKEELKDAGADLVVGSLKDRGRILGMLKSNLPKGQ